MTDKPDTSREAMERFINDLWELASSGTARRTEKLLRALLDERDFEISSRLTSEAQLGVEIDRLVRERDIAAARTAAAVEAMRKACAAIADAYAAENFRMATDSLVLDRMQRLAQTEERTMEGNAHSAAGITAQNIAAAIPALPLPDANALAARDQRIRREVWEEAADMTANRGQQMLSQELRGRASKEGRGNG